jgi:8-oxo-dGTP diphosphatase
MRLLYATGNPAKIEAMRRRISILGIEIYGLESLDAKLPQVPETGKSPLENAIQKAKAYFAVLKVPLFSCDSGLYFDNVPEEVQPGVNVRTVNGKRLSDVQMQAYYMGLAREYGDLVARYKNAVCLVLDENHVYSAMEKSMESEPFLMTSKPHPKNNPGFPLDSISIDLKSGKYYYDLQEGRLDTVAVEDGFLTFFGKHVGNMSK